MKRVLPRAIGQVKQELNERNPSYTQHCATARTPTYASTSNLSTSKSFGQTSLNGNSTTGSSLNAADDIEEQSTSSVLARTSKAQRAVFESAATTSPITTSGGRGNTWKDMANLRKQQLNSTGAQDDKAVCEDSAPSTEKLPESKVSGPAMVSDLIDL